jgi:hypothetical protein
MKVKQPYLLGLINRAHYEYLEKFLNISKDNTYSSPGSLEKHYFYMGVNQGILYIEHLGDYHALIIKEDHGINRDLIQKLSKSVKLSGLFSTLNPEATLPKGFEHLLEVQIGVLKEAALFLSSQDPL